ncbi:Altered inheritance of mitochondria protein-like protein [Lachnellula willkommii]|uniref:Altered inheritance of mitochondria protein 6 n=1 Tax=Lachnellula willkommii TaxID=215461 RepID=A0A559MC22_9HELO|nr:Altered inheritance of mitochondria protein-like protein [Lachnellula willkommii]
MENTASEKKEVEPRVTVVDIEEGVPRSQKCKTRVRRFGSVLRRSFQRSNKSEASPWPKLVRRILYLVTVILCLATIGYVIYHSLLLTLIRRITPPAPPTNGLTKIVTSWVEPGTVTPAPPSWLPQFSRDVQPKAIHSHNDYWRQVPLFDALALGITGVEADCHLVNGELFVGHKATDLRNSRTFRSLYLDPLTSILTNQNAANGIASSSAINGVWDVNNTQGIVLMTDLKTEGFATLAAVQEQLEPLRQKGWLTYWNGTAIVPGPITHVGTGNTPFAAVLNSSYSNSTYRSVFFDAPLDKLSSNLYNASNSYYSSVSINKVFSGKWKIARAGLSKTQLATVKSQIEKAGSLGLVSRYWDLPAWPVDTRMTVWEQLESLGVGMLNVDAIDEATRWNWKWCHVLGLTLC